MCLGVSVLVLRLLSVLVFDVVVIIVVVVVLIIGVCMSGRCRLKCLEKGVDNEWVDMVNFLMMMCESVL